MKDNFVVLTLAGIKWWRHEQLTRHAMRKGLRNHCWTVEAPDGVKRFVTLEKGRGVHETQQLDAAAMRLDVAAFVQKTRMK